ncbi:MAG: CPBP family intramembrane metalloprotease [Candidatus Dormibacteraceae bacterium]
MFVVGLLPLPVVLLANMAVGHRWAHHVAAILTGFLAGVTFLYGAIDLAGQRANPTSTGHNSLAVDIGFMATALVAAVLMSKPVRERLSRMLPVDPDNPVHALALVLTVLLFGVLVTSTAFIQTSVADQPALTVGDLIAQEVPLLIIGAAGVGLFIRRNLAATATRLGLGRPAWWHVVIAMAAAGLFYAFAEAMHTLSLTLTPDVARQVDSTTQHLFGGLGGPLGIAVIALAPGICEEILFRGALQPRIGLIATAFLFTAFHAQYGLSLDALSVLMIALGLGLIRKFSNTTTSLVSHVTYNLVVGIGIAGAQMTAVAIGIEVVLIAVSAYAIWSYQRRSGSAGELLTTTIGSHEKTE